MYTHLSFKIINQSLTHLQQTQGRKHLTHFFYLSQMPKNNKYLLNKVVITHTHTNMHWLLQSRPRVQTAAITFHLLCCTEKVTLRAAEVLKITVRKEMSHISTEC